MKLAASVLLLSLWMTPVIAREVPLYLMEVPPYAMNEAQHKGIVGDIVLEAMRRSGDEGKLVVVPTNRAIVIVRSPGTRDTLIIPLARIPEREGQFTWIAPIARVNRAFFTTGAHITSFAQARAQLRKIGVARGTAGVGILRGNGFKDGQIYELREGEAAIRMLAAGRIDAWYGPASQMEAMLKDSASKDGVRKGASLGATDNYLACSLRCDGALVARLAGALAAMDKDGTSRAITARYSPH